MKPAPSSYSTAYDYADQLVGIKDQRERFVYGWWRPSLFQYLYIGYSASGLQRILRHDVIGVLSPILEEDVLRRWYEPANDLLGLERYLIELFRPPYNRQYNPNPIYSFRKPFTKKQLAILNIKNYFQTTPVSRAAYQVDLRRNCLNCNNPLPVLFPTVQYCRLCCYHAFRNKLSLGLVRSVVR